VLPVLDRDVERMPARIEVRDDGLDSPVAIAVDDVAPVADGEELGVVPGVLGPRAVPGADADCGRVGAGALRLAPLAQGPTPLTWLRDRLLS